MNVIDNARAALEAWDDPDHDAWYDRNLIDPPHMVVNALRDLMAEYERVTAAPEWEYGIREDAPTSYYGEIFRCESEADARRSVVAHGYCTVMRRRKVGEWEPVEAAR